ncbi:hypothetical protein [Kitasatospora kifunensis]|uniref:Uncharacterized protein n=1 Tax=Kitasatospora kifunensis TaxID=58351 RepID=A0A7W7VWF4_KITKI|nr:hypothetical protein [Kitasatospora kifunensis]MBB4924928.1 hypothetical protein [Kitasatospora kifunensis]
MSVFTFNTVSLPAPLSGPAIHIGGTVRVRAFLAQVLRRLADSPLDSPVLRTMQPAAPRATTHRQQVRLSAEWHTVTDAAGASHLEAAWHTEN